MTGITINFWHIIFLAASAQGLFLSVVLFVRKKQASQANYFLSSLVLLFSITLTFYVFYWAGISNKFGLLFSFVLKLVLLFGPLAYLYVKFILGSNLTPKVLRHFYLFPLVLLLLFIPNISLNITLRKWMPLIDCASLMVYTFLIFRQVKFAGLSDTKIEKFLIQFAWLFAGFTLSYISYYLFYYTGILKLEYDYAISFSMAGFIYFIGYRGYFIPEISKGEFAPGEKYEKSGLTGSAEKFYADRIIHLMNVEKIYTNSDLRLGDLAKEMNISSHHVSQVINSVFKQSFSDLINGFRIKAAIRMMNAPEFSEETIIGIAYACGFNNKVSFNNAFRKFTGVAPGIFRKWNVEERALKTKSKYPPIEA